MANKSSGRSRGRPTKYHAIYVPLLAEYMARVGLIDKDIAKVIGANESTLTRWKQRYPALREALERGKNEPNEKVISSLLREAIGYMQEESSETFDGEGKLISKTVTNRWMRPTTGAFAFWLKNRDPDNWRDKWDISHTTDEPLQKFAEAMREFRLGNDTSPQE